MRREGLQARGSYKEVPRPSRGLALAATKRSHTIRHLIAYPNISCTSYLYIIIYNILGTLG